MTEKVSYDTQVKGMARRAKELEELLSKPDKVERAVRGKVKDLESDKDKLMLAATEYLNSLKTETDGELIEKVCDDQPELLDRIDQALEKAKEFLSEEEHKLNILEKGVEAKDSEKVIERALNTVDKKVKEFDSSNLMPRSIFATLEAKMSSIEADVNVLAKNYLYLVSNDEAKKVEYEGKVQGLETHREKILDIRLAMGDRVEKMVVETKNVQSVTSTGMPRLEQFPIPPPQFGYQTPILSLPGSEAKLSSIPVVGQAASSAPGQVPVVPLAPPVQVDGQVNRSASNYPKLQMQKLKAPVFDGDVCCFAGWKKQWREMVHPNCSGEIEELYRMQDAMGTKNLKQVLKSFQSLRDAWSYLDDKFGRADIAAVMMITEFKNMDLGRVSDHEKFMNMHEKFKNLATNLNEIGQLASLNSLTEVNIIVSMLPGEVKTEYAKYKSGNMHLMGYSLLAAFMDHQVVISRECVVAVQAVSGSGTHAGGGKGPKKDVKCYKCQEDGHYAKDCVQRSVSSPKGLLKLNGLSAKPVNCPLCIEPHKITDGKNLGKFKTRLSSCEKFRDMSISERSNAMEKAQACVKCTDWTHKKGDCDAKFGNKPWQSCTAKDGSGQKCAQKHHNLLHGSTHAYICMIVAVNRAVAVVEDSAAVEEVETKKDQCVEHCDQSLPDVDDCEVLLLMQKIPIVSGPSKTALGLTFFDGGSSMGLIREKFARKLGLKGRKVVLIVQVVGQDWTKWETVLYAVTLVDKHGHKQVVKAYSIESITSPIDRVLLDDVMCKFPDVRPMMIQRPEGPVDLLVGLDRSSLHPKAVTSVGDLTLYESIFGSGLLIGGTDPILKTSAVVFNAKANKLRGASMGQFVKARKINFINHLGRPLVNFLEAEEMGTIQPKRCTSCLSCGDCSNKAVEFSRKQQAELRLIQESVSLNKELKRVEVKYPAIKDFSVLTDNREQVIARAKSLEKRLIKSGMKECYDGQLKDFIARGAIVELSDEERDSYDGPVNYLDHHGVLSDSATTPYRFVINSSLDNNGSGVSLNDCIPKGPNSIKSLLGCIITFRSYPHVVVFDLSKCYQQMFTGEKEKHLRRIVWRFNTNEYWKTFAFLRVTYGDRIAACALEVAKKLILEWGMEIHPETALKMGLADYVDDCNAGADTNEEIDVFIGDIIKAGDKFKYTGTISQILGQVDWSAKVMVRDGEKDPAAIAKIKGQYLGLNWDPTTDTLKYKLKVNLTPKIRGVRPGNPPDITMENIEMLDSKVLDLRIVASVVYSWYDPPGLFCPVILRYKILLSDTIQAGVNWKDVLPDEFQILWKKALKEVIAMTEVTFKRSVKPEGVEGLPILIGYHDGSKKGIGCAIYIRWKLTIPRVEHGLEERMVKYHVQLVVAKAKIAKSNKVPRNEIDSLTMLARLLTAILPGLVIMPASVLIVGDSKCTIQSVEAESKILKDFFNNRCEEFDEHVRQWIRDGIDVEPLYYTPSEDNISDLATRGEVSIEQIDENSEWQNGPRYLKYDRDDTWPIDRVSGQDAIPEDEKVVRIFAAVISKREQDSTDNWQDKVANLAKFGTEYSELRFDSVRWVAERHRDLRKVLRILARLIAASTTKDRASVGDEPTAVKIMEARAMLEIVYGQDTAKEVLNGKLVGLDPVLSAGRYVTRGRFGQGIALVLGLVELPILLNSSYLAYLVMVAAHNETHNDAKSTLARSRSQAWVVHGYSLAKRVCSECNKCKLDRKKLMQQKMGYLPVERIEIGFPPFTNLSVDLAAPILVLDMVKKRTSMKCWPVIFCCLNTGAVHLELLHTYGAEAFLMRWKVFTCTRGDPKLVVSDKGSQLMAAAKVIDWTVKEDPTKWDWQKIEQMTAIKGTKWDFVPAGCQWQNGLAESRIKIFKQTFRRCVIGTINGNMSLLSYGEMQVLMADIMDKMNNRPIGLKSLTEEFLVPLTPNCLLLGRTTSRVPTLGESDYKVEDYPSRLRYSMELMQYWVREYEKQVFYSLLPYQKWKDAKRHTNLRVGDVCMLMYPGKIQDKYRYCRVDEVHPDQDGVVRNVTVTLRCRNAREKLLLYKAKKPMKIKVGVQRLCLICPQEEISNQLNGASDEKVAAVQAVSSHVEETDVVNKLVNPVDDYSEVTIDVINDNNEVIEEFARPNVVVKVDNEGAEAIEDLK